MFMSFTTNIKTEIDNIEYSRVETMSELSAILNIAGNIEKNNFYVYTENLGVARRIYKMLKDAYQINVDMEIRKIIKYKRTQQVVLTVSDKRSFILKDLSIISEEYKRIYTPKEFLLGSDEEKRAYLRGAFLICGSINDPKTARYHLEFIIPYRATAMFLKKLLNEYNYNAKVLKRENHYMVYIKEAERISDFIKLLNAYNSLFYYEDIRIYRDHKNMTNRLNNCEQANIEKSLNSSNEQLKMIDILMARDDYELLDEKIRIICEYKKKYPESSMLELSEIISYETGKNITKSGINHRMRKIKELTKKEMELEEN